MNTQKLSQPHSCNSQAHILNLIHSQNSKLYILISFYFISETSYRFRRGLSPSTYIYVACLASDLDGFRIGLLHLLLRNRNSEHPILHGGLHLLHFRILRQPEPAEEPPAASLHAVPRVPFVLLLPAPLTTYLQHPPFLDLHLHLLLLQPRQVRFEHVSLRCLLPIDARVRNRRRLVSELRSGTGECGAGGEREVLERVPYVEGERVEDVGPSPCAEDAWSQRHWCWRLRKNTHKRQKGRWKLLFRCCDQMLSGECVYIYGVGGMFWSLGIELFRDGSGLLLCQREKERRV